MATYDALTGLMNRRFYEEAVETYLGNVGNKANKHVLLVIDIDNFKRANDEPDHPAGDELLADPVRFIGFATAELVYHLAFRWRGVCVILAGYKR